MASSSSFQDAWQVALDIEKELLKHLADNQPTFADISHYLAEFRNACQNALLLDFDAARDADVEGRLWEAHLKLNTRFRKLLARHREEHAKKRPVERRKLEKHYLDFIKSSQRFYRGYIQHLSSHFGGIVELQTVARRFKLESLPAQHSYTVTPALRQLILQSCHATLIRLGDLSRYRETELVSKDRDWGPARGYYDLASVIYPASGASHNQLAVIALADGDHFRATYHLYRALAAQEPHPSAKGNLEIEFRKVMAAWTKKELIRPEDAGIPGKALVPWFVYLHAQCYKGKDFPEHDELESEVMSQLAVEIRERLLETTLHKLCLVNIAAEDFSRAQSAKEPDSKAPGFFQRINVKTFFTLLQILLVELERYAVEDSSSSEKETDRNGPDRLTVVARRILPSLRHYSSWLLITSDMLIAQNEEKDSPLAIQIQEFWKIYAETLTLLASTFDVVNLPEIDYLLEEDAECLCFAPLDQPATSRRYVGTGQQPKPRLDDPGVARSHPNIEMLYRIREFVIDGLDLVVRNRIPIALVDDDDDKKTFIYQEDGLPSQFFSSPHARHHALATPTINREDIPQASQDSNSVAEAHSTFDGSQSASASMSANMHRIVEDVERLVESDTYENVPSLPDRFAFVNDTGEMPTPSSHMVASGSSFPFNETPSQSVRTPIAPPGLGPPNPNAVDFDSLRPSLPQPYTPLPALAPSIWSTSARGGLSDGASPHAHPGLGQPSPMQPLASNMSVPQRPSSQDQVANDLLRQGIMGHNQLPSTLDPAGPVPSSFFPPSNSSPMHPHGAANTWERDAGHPMYSSYDLPSQPTSSGLANQTWANEAFIASSNATARGFYNSNLSGDRKSSAQLGAIGETPPCGQGG